jgi:hypothetical protein
MATCHCQFAVDEESGVAEAWDVQVGQAFRLQVNEFHLGRKGQHSTYQIQKYHFPHRFI